MTLRRAILIRLIVVSLSSFVGIGIGELIARAVLTDFFVCDENLGWAFDPGRSGFRINRRFEYAVRVRLNREGFHDLDHDPTARPGTRRIVLLGDSMLAGMQVPLESTFAQRLAARLEGSADGPWEVINCAVDGYGTAQALRMFDARCARYEPEIVVLGFYSYNDVLDNYHAGGSTNHPLAYRCGRPYFRLEGDGIVPTLGEEEAAERTLGERVDRFLRASYLYQMIHPYYDKGKRRAFLNREVYSLDASEPVREAWEITRRLVVNLDERVHARGARLVVMLIPSRWEIYPDWGTEDWGIIPDQDLDRPARMMTAFLSDHGIASFDLKPAFATAAAGSDEPLFFRRDPHWRESGNEVTAGALESWLHGGFLAPRAGEGIESPSSDPP